jgi:betaine-aldehyde dehydrogenase
MTGLVNPATGVRLEEVADSEVADVAKAVARAREAFEQWREATPAERARVLLKVADLVERDAASLTRLEVEETGKPLPVMRDGELPFSVDNLRFFAGAARSLDGTGAGVLSAGYTSRLIRRPIGVVGSIAPWNFPLVMAVWKIGPAVAAGNAVVIKPAPRTPRSTLVLARLFEEAGAPAGLLGVVTGGAEIGSALVRDPGVDMVSARALRVAHRLDVGVTWINDHLPIASEAPHGGVKGSGFGKDMSQEAVAEYSATRHLMIKHAAPAARDSFRPA